MTQQLNPQVVCSLICKNSEVIETGKENLIEILNSWINNNLSGPMNNQGAYLRLVVWIHKFI